MHRFVLHHLPAIKHNVVIVIITIDIILILKNIEILQEIHIHELIRGMMSRGLLFHLKWQERRSIIIIIVVVISFIIISIVRVWLQERIETRYVTLGIIIETTARRNQEVSRNHREVTIRCCSCCMDNSFFR